MTRTVILYHNPHCSKSRAALDWLQTQTVKIEQIDYLATPPDSATLRQLQQQLKANCVRDIMRTQESTYRDLNLSDSSLNEHQLLEALQAHPQLLERPIAVIGAQAAIGRPLENIMTLLAEVG